jgi:hypothetical protein
VRPVAGVAQRLRQLWSSVSDLDYAHTFAF